MSRKKLKRAQPRKKTAAKSRKPVLSILGYHSESGLPVQPPLLVDFCNTQIQCYVPPARTKRKKGVRAAFTKTKYTTSVLALFDWEDPTRTLRALAEEGKVDYQVVRRWVTEKVFKDKVDEHIKAFAPVFFGYLRGWQGRYAKALDTTGEDRSALLSERKDKLRAVYSLRLSLVLCDLILEEMGRADNVPWMNILHVAADILCSNPWLENQREIFLKHKRGLAIRIIDATSEAIAKPKIPLSERKNLLAVLDMLSDNIAEGRL